MGSSKKSLNRPKKRTLVRWDENLNELLLLTVQSVCNTHSVKIPWAEVAKTMGNKVTEGAIVQHLAKLRNRRAAIGKDVPPPLRRGGIGAAIKPSKPSTGSKRKAPRRLSADSDDESSVQFECDDASSDEGYTENRRSKRKPKMAKKRASSPIKQESDSEQDSRVEGGASSEELLVPGAKFLDFPNSDVSEDSSTEHSPSPLRESKIVVLKYRHQSADSQQLVVQGEEELAPLPIEAGGALPEVIDNTESEQPVGFDFNINIPPADIELNSSDYSLFQPFEAMPENSYINHDSITYESPVENHSELPPGMMGDPNFFFNEEFSFLYQDLLESEGIPDFP